MCRNRLEERQSLHYIACLIMTERPLLTSGLQIQVGSYFVVSNKAELRVTWETLKSVYPIYLLLENVAYDLCRFLVAAGGDY